MRIRLFLGMVILALLPAQALAAGHIVYTADLRGAKEVPATTSTATGVAFLVLQPDNSLRYAVASTGFGAAPNAVIAAHIHLGSASVNGAVFKPLSLDAAGNGTGTIQLTNVERDTFLRNEFYVNLHTTQFPGGAIRGQLDLRPGLALRYVSTLSGAKENPPTTSAATGTARVFLDAASSRLAYWVTSAGFGAAPNAVTAAHIHLGGALTNGAVLIPLTLDASGNGLGIVTVTDAQKTSLLQNELYVNLHTGQFPAGAIRGQMEVDPGPSVQYVFNRNITTGDRQIGIEDGPSIVDSAALANRQVFELMNAALSLGSPQITATPAYPDLPGSPLRFVIVTRTLNLRTDSEFFVAPGTVSLALDLPAGISQPDFRSLFFQDYAVSVNDLSVNQMGAVPFLFGPVVVGGPQLESPVNTPSQSVTGYNLTLQIQTPGEYVVGVRWKVGRSLAASGLIAAEINVVIPVSVGGERPLPPYLESPPGLSSGGILQARLELEQLIQQALEEYTSSAPGSKTRRH